MSRFDNGKVVFGITIQTESGEEVSITIDPEDASYR
jgi:hypothetical protein